MLAIVVAVAQVGCDILALQPLKWIPSKVQNPGNDPACNLPFLGLNDKPGLLDLFDTPALNPSLNPPPGSHQVQPPPTSPCPVNLSNPKTLLIPDTTHHSVTGVIVFSVIVLVIFATLSALLAYLDLYFAMYIAQHLGARLRKQLFEHLQRISLDWHGKQKKGAERIQEVLDQAPEVIESTAPYHGPTKLRGDIAFENVVFGYSPERSVLKGINLQIPAGKKVALVGLSGGGKTTLVKLIPRFYEIQ